MDNAFSLFEKAHHAKFLGSRFKAKELRIDLEELLSHNDEIVVDFTGFDTTQSFIDEFIGQLVLRMGDQLLQRVVFKGCSEDAKEIISFVVSDRLSQFHRYNDREKHIR